MGESLEQRQSGRTEPLVTGQVATALADLSAKEVATVTIAYEPVWAIGTGKTATPAQAEAVHSDLRSLVESRYNSQIAQGLRIQYGGSVKADNAKQLLSQENIDGALVGGASLKVDDFMAIIDAAP